MPDEGFEVGDRVFLPTKRQSGRIAKVTQLGSPTEPQASPLKLYDIALDSGKIVKRVCYGIVRPSHPGGEQE